jgi:endonuclease-8
VGHRVVATSPQGRFASGAEVLSGREVLGAVAVGKQMFLDFDGGVFLRVHLGLYGAWDFAGRIDTDPTIESAGGRMGQTNQRGTTLVPGALSDGAFEDSVSSIGAPRRARVRMSEQTSALPEGEESDFPPPPVGAVRVRLLTAESVADLRGPTACELIDAGGVQAVIDRLGPDPLVDDADTGERRFVERAGRKATPIGLLLMDQAVVSGIGNVYRAELLFRARLNPHTPGRSVPRETLAALWLDWSVLLRVGVETGQMMTMDGLDGDAYVRAMASRADRHWVYKREGLPCRVCGTSILLEEMGARKVYWCPVCQA